MARNNDRDTLSALLGLGILGAIASDGGNIPPFAVPNSTPSGATAQQPQKKPMSQEELLKNGAKSAWKLYESYMDVGFESEQAFELLKAVLTTRR